MRRRRDPESCRDHQLVRHHRRLRRHRGPASRERSDAVVRFTAQSRSDRAPVAVTVYRVDVLWVFRIRFDLPAEARDEVVHAAGERDVLIAPNVSKQFVARDDLAGAGTHIMQYVDFTLAEGHLLILALG